MRPPFGSRSVFLWLMDGSRFLPVMVGRMMLSLRRAADRPLGEKPLAELSANDLSIGGIINSWRPRRNSHAREDIIMLDKISRSQTGA